MACLYFRSRVERSYDRLHLKPGEVDPNWFDGTVVIDNNVLAQKLRLMQDVEDTKRQLTQFATETEENYFPDTYLSKDSELAFIVTEEGNECIFVIMRCDTIPQTPNDWKQFFPENLMDKFGNQIPEKFRQLCDDCVLRPNLLTVINMAAETTKVFDLYQNPNAGTRKEAAELLKWMQK